MDQNLLKHYSYYKTGGRCNKIISPSSIEELADTIQRLYKDKIPYFVLGSGSNSLIMDDHWPHAVILFGKMNRIRFEEGYVYAEAGVENSYLVEQCAEYGRDGLTFLAYLPGQIGATVRMNARCYGSEVKDVIYKVVSVSKQGEIHNHEGQASFYGYKATRFQKDGDIVAAASFHTTLGEKEDILDRMLKCKKDRASKNQFQHPSCGCVFKNDYNLGLAAGFLLELADVSEFNTKTVEINPLHANFVFNKGATSRELLETTLKMREKVYKRFGVFLEYEMEILGLVPSDLKDRVQEKHPHKITQESLENLKRQFENRKRS